jgi:dipeptidyl aminopeptidase/acylaminoacyl peptidase
VFRRIILALWALVGSCALAQAAPLEAYGKLPSIEQAAISPRGKLVAYIITDGDERTVAVQDVAQQKLIYIGHVGAAKVRRIDWAGDEHLIFTVSTTRQPYDVEAPRVEWSMAYDLSLVTRRMRLLLDNPSGVAEAMNTISGPPQVRKVNDKPTVFVRGMHFVNNVGQWGLFQVNPDTDRAELIAPGGGGAYDWVVGADGKVLAEAAYVDRAGTWALKVKSASGSWRTIKKVAAPIDTPDLVGLGRDGRSVVVNLADEKDGWAWRELSTETATWADPIHRDNEGAAIQDPATGKLIGDVALVGDSWTYEFFDAHDAAVWRSVTKAFPGDIVRLVSWSDDRKKIVVRADSAQFGPAYALVDLATLHADWLGNEYAEVKSSDIAAVKPLRFKAADGVELTGYLTLPRGADPHALPLVVLAHGGPAARDELGFDWWAQALASRGYAVLQVNFRGSDGFGSEFLRSGFGEWGRKMQTDLSDGVYKLAAEGVIDPKRVCIVGASYGGYAALAGATFQHGIYRCAVSYAGPAELRIQLMDSRAKGGREALRYWQRYVGARDLADPVLAEVSPAQHAANVNIPVLLIHGRDDTVVPIVQSRKMAKALRDAGKPVELVELKGEDHWLSTGATRLQMLTATVDFLEKNNPPH